MKIDLQTLETLRRNHPAWRLLRSDHAPFVASFLHRVFVEPNQRSIPQANMVERLEDFLYGLRQISGEDSFPKSAQDYLNDWADNERGWLRKYYPSHSDEPHFDLTPATEKALQWLESLGVSTFVGTESRLLTLCEILRQIAEGTETDPALRIAELEKRRNNINKEIDRIAEGHVPVLDDTAIRDRFQQFEQIARDLLSDFRQVEYNFRLLDRQVREKIALWQGSKGALLQEIIGQRDAIEDSDQGRSFRSFWSFLMSQQRQDELTILLEQILSLSAVEELHPDPRLRRVHYDWLEAGEHTQRTVAQLSQQLRRFLDDKAWLENRRIMDLLHAIETVALEVREKPPANDFMSIAAMGAAVELPMERPLFNPPNMGVIVVQEVEQGDQEVDIGVLFSQVVIEKAELKGHIRQALQERTQVSLREILVEHPLKEGLLELLTYLQLASESQHVVVEETVLEDVEWTGRDGIRRRGKLPKIIFMRS